MCISSASGSQLGSLSHCPVAQLVQLKTLAIDPNAYGAIVNWTAAEVGELKFVLGKYQCLLYNSERKKKIFFLSVPQLAKLFTW